MKIRVIMIIWYFIFWAFNVISKDIIHNYYFIQVYFIQIYWKWLWRLHFGQKNRGICINSWYQFARMRRISSALYVMSWWRSKLFLSIRVVHNGWFGFYLFINLLLYSAALRSEWKFYLEQWKNLYLLVAVEVSK
jgi:hypothetical protein